MQVFHKIAQLFTVLAIGIRAIRRSGWFDLARDWVLVVFLRLQRFIKFNFQLRKPFRILLLGYFLPLFPAKNGADSPCRAYSPPRGRAENKAIFAHVEIHETRQNAPYRRQARPRRGREGICEVRARY